MNRRRSVAHVGNLRVIPPEAGHTVNDLVMSEAV